MKRVVIALLFLIVALCAAPVPSAHAQASAWLSAGSIHNYYMDTGCEIEEALVKKQQYGLRWPAIYLDQDMQAAKALWIGTTNFQEGATLYSHKVVHVGPRVDGRSEFFPTVFKRITKYAPPTVLVDGVPRNGIGGQKDEFDAVDPTITGDQMILNVVNTPIGITMTRKIFQFSQQFHDNYIVQDYVFKNNSGKTLTGVIFYFQYRLSVCAKARYYINNATGWGINAMLDTRGDGVKNDADSYEIANNPASPQMRIQYVWHGKYPPFVKYDNVGGPVWPPPLPASQYGDPSDTTGKLGAFQFVGVLTLHADKSTTDKSDDPGQPSTTSYEGSDEPLTSGNDQFNATKMDQEYAWMSKGHRSPRHADVVEPAGNFRSPTGDPALGTPGGFSNANGYGPYTMAPGDSIHIVMAEGASGLSWGQSLSVGRKYYLGQISAAVKNDSVLSGKDSLFTTFRRAMANYRSNWGLSNEPQPPSSLTVVSAGDKVALTWDVYAPMDPKIKGFRVYRAIGRYDSDYKLVYEGPATARGFNDTEIIRGVANFYYVVSVGDPADNPGTGGTPTGVALTSSRMYTQTFYPAYLKRAAGNALGIENMDSIRVVPNPYSLSMNAALAYDSEPDKIVFFNVPGYCKIKIYTELGELVTEMDHNDGSGDHYWRSVTSSRQVVVSGVYIAVIENSRTGQRVIKKFVVVR
jgi:hypothetical protein